MKRILLSWSSGKDSAWSLHVLRQRAEYEVAGLLTTFNEEAGRVAMHAVRRELAEETGIEVRVGDLIEVFERIFPDGEGQPKYHFVILDYLCEAVRGTARAGSDVTHVAWAAESELQKYLLTPTATRVIKKAFQMARERDGRAGSAH
jgi:ADP-ribose pyrophosphatase YjhB (NUDIX family)